MKMAKGNKEEALPEVKISSNGSLEKSDNDEPEEEEESDKKPKHRRRRKVSGSEREDDREEDGNAPSETGDSVAIPIEDDAPAADAADGKVTQKQANTYAAKKTVAQGMMDIALITANANQLRYLIEFNKHSSTFYVNVFLIVLSLVLQVGVGLSLIFKGGLDLKGQSKHRYAKRINNYVVVGVFLVTIINVFVASFTVTAQPPVGDKGGNGGSVNAAG